MLYESHTINMFFRFHFRKKHYTFRAN